MKRIEAKIVADSVDKRGNRITSFLLTYPRFIHGEVMTHRMFSRNSASSRAIPFIKMVKQVEEDPFIPIVWQKDHKGMQGNEYLDPNKKYIWEEIHSAIKVKFLKGIEEENRSQMIEIFDKYVAVQFNSNSPMTIVDWWLKIKDLIISSVIILYGFGLTKQLCNRLLEPFMWHTVLITATEWDNFFKLRCPQYKVTEDMVKSTIFKSRKDAISLYPECKEFDDLTWLSINESQAEIHIQAVAESIWDAMNESTPIELKADEWHIPFGNKIDMPDRQRWDNSKGELIEAKIKIATARAAR